MGEKLLHYYQYVGDQLGFQGKLKLAQATKVPSARAAIEPDSEENLAIFKEAIRRLTGRPAPVE
jgi:hypothetical protein